MSNKAQDDIISTLRAEIEELRRSSNEEIERISLENRILTENERMLHAMLEKTPEPFQSLDSNGNLLRVNEKWCEELGYTKEEVLGCAFENFLTPTAYKRYLENFPKFKANGHTSNVEFKMLKKDKKEISVSYDGVILYDDRGEMLQTACVFTNITEQKKLQEELLQSYKTLTNIAGNVPGVVCIFQLFPDGKSCFPYASEHIYDTYGVRPQEVLEDATKANNTIHPEDLEDWSKSVQTSFTELTLWEKEFRVIHPDKGVIWIKGMALPEKQSDGSVLWYGYLNDITKEKTAEVQQEQLLEQLEEAQSMAKLGSWQQTFEDETLHCSEEVYHIFEIDSEVDMSFEMFMGRVHPDDREKVSLAFGKSVEDHTAYYLEHRLLFEDNRIKYVIEHAEHFYDKDNTHLRTVGTVQDVTEKVLADKEIKKRDTILTSVFQAIPDLLFIMDKEGLIIDYRAQQDNDLYIKAEQFLGKLMSEVLPQNIGQLFRKNIESLSENSKLSIFNYELEVEGELRHYEARMAQLPEDEHIMAIVRDITEQTSSQHQLKFQAKLLEQSLAATSVVDEDALINYINDAYINMWGYDRKEEILGTSPLTHCADPKMPQIIIETVEKEGEHLFQFKAQKKDGTTFDALMAVKYLHHAGKKYYMGSTIDITELKKKDEILINQSRHAAMGEMISMIAHQWRQPLAVISMDANNMLLDIEIDNFNMSDSKEYANHIVQQTQDLSQTIDDFKNFFKPDKEIVKVNMRKILDQTLSLVQVSLRNNNIELNSTFKTEIKVDTYPSELMQVFVNIITNSKNALVSNKIKNAQINIRVYENEEYLNTEICDNGGGIDADILPKVFDPYFSTKDEKNGTGLGLYMSKMIIENHLNGMIEAHNNDDGACFTVRLLKKSKEA